MTTLEMIAAAGLIFAVLSFIMLALKQPKAGNPMIASMLAAGFGAFTLVVVANEGAEVLWLNQTVNLWGVQLWLDLLLCALIAFYFVVPRASKVGMKIPLWTLFVICTLSIGLLAMIARLFWLEGQAKAET